MYQEDGFASIADGGNPQLLASVGQQNQSNEDALMNQYIADAENTGNVSLALKYYDQAEILGVNLTFYVYLYQLNIFWFYPTAIHGMQYQQNPIYGGDRQIIFIYLTQ